MARFSGHIYDFVAWEATLMAMLAKRQRDVEVVFAQKGLAAPAVSYIELLTTPEPPPSRVQSVLITDLRKTLFASLPSAFVAECLSKDMPMHKLWAAVVDEYHPSSHAPMERVLADLFDDVFDANFDCIHELLQRMHSIVRSVNDYTRRTRGRALLTDELVLERLLLALPKACADLVPPGAVNLDAFGQRLVEKYGDMPRSDILVSYEGDPPLAQQGIPTRDRLFAAKTPPSTKSLLPIKRKCASLDSDVAPKKACCL
ncbi:hypothetical protein SPRG_08484 [Saprolegnia parasitica CBS 223.65]|uniref:Uncharacterized protein n=1 Tax=Saprolegnia parasitica (strain CBS 223.65) TaxID=695850 RepID=A0A067C6J1_SAPPC|nr:hypothetical protein SPRG_08484 [Saprolegnia parasitica CBS 223.65]KDO26123.1 hypothetical protein SPRG_08484 [Saprolegnia parasitica CBS 223.65]|eukprot:XP_012203118.1 hypothetical protein SPRG_08484 [Saprolegnia parasitica CBS 223.65]